jgi:hypothetical protein
MLENSPLMPPIAFANRVLPKARALSSRGTLRVFMIDGLDRFASTSSSPLQFMNAPTQTAAAGSAASSRTVMANVRCNPGDMERSACTDVNHA